MMNVKYFQHLVLNSSRCLTNVEWIGLKMGRDGCWQLAGGGKDTGPCLRASILGTEAAGNGKGFVCGGRQEKGRSWDSAG